MSLLASRSRHHTSMLGCSMEERTGDFGTRRLLVALDGAATYNALEAFNGCFFTHNALEALNECFFTASCTTRDRHDVGHSVAAFSYCFRSTCSTVSSTYIQGVFGCVRPGILEAQMRPRISSLQVGRLNPLSIPLLEVLSNYSTTRMASLEAVFVRVAVSQVVVELNPEVEGLKLGRFKH